MRLKVYQWGELIGVVFLLASTAARMFYVDPLKRELEWLLAAFNMQQNSQVQIQSIYASRLATLKAVNAPDAALKETEAERDKTLERFRTADANISDYLHAKEQVEDNLQIVVLVLFAICSLLAGFGRAMEMIAAGRLEM